MLFHEIFTLTPEQIKAEFNALPSQEQRHFRRAANLARRTEAACWFTETGCHITDPGQWWHLLKSKMENV